MEGSAPTQSKSKTRQKAGRSSRFWSRKVPKAGTVLLDNKMLTKLSAYADKYDTSVSFLVLGALLHAVKDKK